MRTCLIVPLILALVACSARTPPAHAKDRAEIIAAILSRQSDLIVERNAFLAAYPHERSYFEGLFDFRLCVAEETAGSDRDFGPDIGTSSERWEKSRPRYWIADQIRLPSHLRWDTLLTYCPTGVIRLSNPAINGDRATVYIENKCSGWWGWGGTVRLQRTNGRWVVGQMINWWQA